MISLSQEEIMQNWGVTKSNSPLISVCCVTYNHESYITQTLDGFLMQKTTFSFEVIVHDDCSTDGTADIIREYQQKYPDIIKPIFQQENQYSKGIRTILASFMYPKCLGTYIAICEGDDYWIDENKLQMQVDFLEQNPAYTMCFHSVIHHFENGSKADEEFFKLENRDYTAQEIVRKWIIPTGSVCFHKKYIETEFYQTLIADKRFIFGDIILFLTMAKEGKIYGMNKVMGVYRRHQGGAIFGINLDRSYNQYFHIKALGEWFPEVKKITQFKCIRSAAAWCAESLLLSDFERARAFFKLHVFSNFLLVPFYYVKLYRLFRKR